MLNQGLGLGKRKFGSGGLTGAVAQLCPGGGLCQRLTVLIILILGFTLLLQVTPR